MLPFVLALLLSAAEPKRSLPDHAVGMIGEPREAAKAQFAFLPDESGFVAYTNPHIVVRSLDNRTLQRIAIQNPASQTARHGSWPSSWMFFSSDKKHFYHCFQDHLFRYDYPFVDGQTPEAIDRMLPPQGERKVRLSHIFSPRDNQLIGISTTGELHNYDTTARRWKPTGEVFEWRVKRVACVGNLLVVTPYPKVNVPSRVVLYDLNTRKSLEPITVENMTDIALSGDGKRLAALTHKRRSLMLPAQWHISIWDVATRKRRDIALNHPAELITLSYDGKRIACVDSVNDFGLDKQNRFPSVEFYDIDRDKPIALGRFGGDYITFGGFLDGDKSFAAFGEAGVLHRWDVATGKRFPSDIHENPVVHVSCLPKGGFATGSTDGTYRRWNADLKPISRFEILPEFDDSDASSNSLPRLSVTADETRLYSRGRDNLRRIDAWNLTTGRKVEDFQFTLPESKALFGMALSKTGKTLAVVSSGPELQSLDALTGKQTSTHTLRTLGSHDWSRKDARLVFADGDTTILCASHNWYRGVRATSGEETFSVNTMAISSLTAYSFAVRPDGKEFAGIVEKHRGRYDSDLGFWSAETGKLLRSIPIDRPKDPYVTAMAYSPDGKGLVVGYSLGTVLTFDLTAKADPLEYLGHKQAVRCISFAPDGKSFATGSDDTSVIVWKYSK